MTGTSTTAGAREHARAQEGTKVEAQPWIPAASGPGAATDTASPLVWNERIAGGNYSHRALAAGTVIRLTDLDGDACAGLVVYNMLEPWERLNVADTMKIQWQSYSGTGQLLLSDQGRVLASVIEDTSGHHDGFFGVSSKLRNVERYGDGDAFGPTPAGRELLKLAAAKHGLGPRDVPPCLTFFQGVRIDPDGTAEYTGSAGAGASVTLRLEMACIVLIANAAHPLDPRPEYSCGRLDVHAWRGDVTSPDDDLWNASPEGRRAFSNTDEHQRALGLR